MDWFLSYLEGETRRVEHGEHMLSPRLFTSGVVESSVLWPLLCLMYINDACDVEKDCEIFYLHLISKSFATYELQSCVRQWNLTVQTIWCSLWLVKFFTKLSNVIVYGCDVPVGSISLNVYKLQIAHSGSDITIRYSSTFNLFKHVSYQIAECKGLIVLIKHSLILSATLMIFYKTFVRQTLNYCMFTYCYKRNTENLSWKAAALF